MKAGANFVLVLAELPFGAMRLSLQITVEELYPGTYTFSRPGQWLQWALLGHSILLWTPIILFFLRLFLVYTWK